MSFSRSSPPCPRRAFLPSAGPRARRRLRRTLPQPAETAPPSTVSTATPLEAKTAAPWTRLGRRTRWALLGTLAIAAIVVAIVVAAGGGGSVQPADALHPDRFARPRPSLHAPTRPEPRLYRQVFGGRPGCTQTCGGFTEARGETAKCPGGCLQRNWDAVGPGLQPRAAVSLAVVFKSETAAQQAFANLQAGLEKGAEPAMPGPSGGPGFDWGVGGDSLGVLRNGSTAPEYQYLWRTGNLLQDFELGLEQS